MTACRNAHAARDLTKTIAGFRPFWTLLKCAGEPVFTSAADCDQASLLEIDRSVRKWSYRRASDAVPEERASFFAEFVDGSCTSFDGSSQEDRSGGFKQPASMIGFAEGYRIQNAKDLLRYSTVDVPLADRLLVLSAIADETVTTLGQCFRIPSLRSPIATVASLYLHEHIDFDIDTELLAPDTVIQLHNASR